LYFPVRYQLSPAYPTKPFVEDKIGSPLNPPLSVNAADPNATPLILQDATIMLTPGISYTFQLENVSGAWANFYELPRDAKIVASGREKTISVDSGWTGFLPNWVLAPNDAR
jgi:hypothetical protein